MKFIDSNISLRYITGDDPRQQQAAADIMGKVMRGEEDAFTTDVHLHETAYILASRTLYGVSHSDIRDRLRPLLLLKGLKMSNKRICLEALDIFALHGHLDFADSLAVAHIRRQHLDGIFSFDKDFDRVPGMQRHES